jgi:hypothetical protein
MGRKILAITHQRQGEWKKKHSTIGLLRFFCN